MTLTRSASLLLLVGMLISAAASRIYKDTYKLLYSEVQPGNLLPTFRFQLGAVEGGDTSVPLGGGKSTARPFIPDDTCPEEFFDHASKDLSAPQLPHLTQDDWTCDRKPAQVPSFTFENEQLRLAITPQWGGRIWSLFDKRRQREVVFANPAHQPANIAVLKAWTAGGIEWNWSPGLIGHSVFSESPVWMGTLDTERGEVLRIWEFDRWEQSVWSVDLLLSNETLWVHPRVMPTKVHDGDDGDACLQGYWWTCVAYAASPETRVLTPAEYTAETSAGNMRRAPWPAFSMGDGNATFAGREGERLTDNSFLGAVTSGDFFMGPLTRLDDPVNDPRYIAHTQEDGFVSIHGHPHNGTKFFTPVVRCARLPALRTLCTEGTQHLRRADALTRRQRTHSAGGGRTVPAASDFDPSATTTTTAAVAHPHL